MIKRMVILAMLCVFPQVALGRVSRVCKVSYETRYGWSDEYRMEVTFVTGRELNKATRTYNYSPFSHYALLWFDVGEAAILEHEGMLIGVGEEFDNEDFRSMFRFLGESEFRQVNAHPERRWRVMAKEYIKFIDPRAEE